MIWGRSIPAPTPSTTTRANGSLSNTLGNERVLDLTDWSLYFSRRTGYNFADVYEAPADPHTRWIVVRDGQIDGPSPYCQVIRDLIGDRRAGRAATGGGGRPIS